MKNPQTWFANSYVKNTPNCQVYRCVFLSSIYLLKIIVTIIKANTTIVSTSKPNKSKYIISNKTASIIAPPPYSQQRLWMKEANHICLFSFPMLASIT